MFCVYSSVKKHYYYKYVKSPKNKGMVSGSDRLVKVYTCVCLQCRHNHGCGGLSRHK